MHTREEQLAAFDRLLTIMDELREKCPWDRKQTMETLRHLTIEETYELGDAILDNNLDEVRQEIGDLLLHMVFYSKIGSEKKAFDIGDVLHGICDKLVQRHPHIYGDVEVADEAEVKANWEDIKLREGKESVLQGVPRSLPALVKATRIQEKARGVGFDWNNRKQVWEKVNEELSEFNEASGSGNQAQMEAEFGDVLFSLINYARFVDIDPEMALERTNKKFISRFQHMEKAVKADGRNMRKLSLEELDTYWNRSKQLI